MGARSSGVVAATVLFLLTACNGGQDSGADAKPSPAEAAGTDSTTSPTSTAEVGASSGVATRRLDSVAVIGHSGATGTFSDPAVPGRDATENSWATGDNPDVRSIYLRLLATHPALEGHSYNEAVNGSGVGDLSAQVDRLAEMAEVVPDLVLIQSIDNDMQCDGTDATNYRPFGRTLEQTLSQIDRTMAGARVFFVSQWADVQAWTEWAQGVNVHVVNNSGTGPCDVFDAKGRPRPVGIASMQRIIDSYWAQVERMCARHRGCATDGLALHREFVPTDADLSPDMNHLSIRGHAKFAAIAWRALPESIKKAR